MKILFLHHYYDNADHIGVDAILETYDRLYNEWKDNSVYIMELMLVLNHRCTFWNNEIIKSPQNEKAVEYTSIYLDLFEKLDELLYGPDSWEDAIDL